MLTVDDVTFAYAPGAPVLSDVTFHVPPGQVVAIVGRNGAGKSTLLRLLNGLYQPATGAIVVNGNATSDTPVHLLARFIGTVFQAPEQQIFNAKVVDEIAFGPKQLGLTGKALDERVGEVLQRIGLAGEAETHPLDIDASARRMVAIGSVLAMQPPVLLLDEAQRGLDKAAIDRLARIIADEKARGTTVLLVCHDMDFVARNADRVLGLAQGRLAADLSTEAFFTDAALTAAVGVEVPDMVSLSAALGLAPALSPERFAAAWMARNEA